MGNEQEREGFQGSEGTDQSSQDTSGNESQQTSGQGQLSVEELLQSEAASKYIAEQVEKGVASEFQKNKDKRLQQVDDNKTEIQRIRELVEGKGLSFDEADAQIQSENRQIEIETKLNALIGDEAGGAGDTNKTWTERETAMLSGRGISPDNPELVRFRRSFDTPEEYVKALPDRLWQLQSGAKGDESGASGGQGSGVASEDLQAEYDARIAGLSKPIPPHVLADTKAEFRKKGLPIY